VYDTSTREHDHGLSIIMRMAAVKSGQLGLIFSWQPSKIAVNQYTTMEAPFDGNV